jgi:hypothetical protein
MSRRFQFSLKTLLVALTVACAWLGRYAEGVRRQQEAVALVESLGAQAYHLYEWDDSHDWFQTGPVHEPGPVWMVQLVGIEWLNSVVAICFDGNPVSESDLIWLFERLPELRYLELRNANIGDRGFSNIDKLRRLRNLEVANTQIGDRAMETIGQIRSLRSLDLCGTRVTDRGLNCLRGLVELDSIYLESTQVTADGIASLRRTLPQVQKRRY